MRRCERLKKLDQADIDIMTAKLEKWYKNSDPWGYKTNPEDLKKKNYIIEAIKKLNIHFETALDIGCGEGFITKDIPAEKVYGYDVSKKALGRLPADVIPVQEIDWKTKYDLVVLSDLLYKQYHYERALEIAKRSARHIIVTCNIKSWENNDLKNPIYERDFQYRQYIMRLAVYPATVYVGHHICSNEEEKLNRNYALREKLAQDYVKFVTFDDVSETVWKNRDLLKGKKFILFPVGNYVGKENGEFGRREKSEKLCSKEQLQDLIDMGGKIGWHTWTHPNLKRVSNEQLERELKCPFKTDYFAYPYGKFNSRVIEAVRKAGFKYAFSVGKGKNTDYQLLRKYL